MDTESDQTTKYQPTVSRYRKLSLILLVIFGIIVVGAIVYAGYYAIYEIQ